MDGVSQEVKVEFLIVGKRHIVMPPAQIVRYRVTFKLNRLYRFYS